MGQMGFFDIETRYRGLDAKGDPLVKINEIIPWESFRAELKAAWRRRRATRRPDGRRGTRS